MRPIRDILVRVPKAYIDAITCDSGLVLHLDENIKQVKDTIRYGEVIAVPSDCKYDIKVGETLYFHHNIVAVTVMDEGDIDSSFLVDKEECIYRVPLDPNWPMAFGVLRDVKFKPLDGTCFVRPIIETATGFEIEDKLKPQYGVMVYSCKSLEDVGIKEGTTVIFDKDSEYEFNIMGEKLYRMNDNWILASL
jgi:co-chaperonin GroES (HSP10)